MARKDNRVNMDPLRSARGKDCYRTALRAFLSLGEAENAAYVEGWVSDPTAEAGGMQ